MRDRFEKQRRNLITISVALCVYYYLGFELEKLSFFGNSVEIKSPENVSLGLWVIWFYFLVRYFQYFRVVDRSEFVQLYENNFSNLIKKSALKRFVKDDSKSTLAPEHGEKVKSIKRLEVDIMSIRSSSVECSIRGSAEISNNEFKTVSDDFSFNNYLVEGWRVYLARLRAFINWIFETPVFTEYYLPLVVAFFPMIFFSDFS